MEAALWKRHYKATQQRMKVFREKEDKFRQDKFLEAVYKERLVEREAAGEDSEEDWDPIEEVLEDSRGNYIGMFRSGGIWIYNWSLGEFLLTFSQILSSTSFGWSL